MSPPSIKSTPSTTRAEPSTVPASRPWTRRRLFPRSRETLYLFVFTQFRTENRFTLFLELL
ncbi:hypothetical protein EOD23_18950 [Mesorhizobium sp. USDA-HM6]|nr:hypothetical protein EOD23_18950 [Mesorhizobium sp. USDA-HM6]